MAITFSEHTINGKVLNAFNNSIVRYKSDSTNTIVKSEVIITAGSDSYAFEILPAPDDSFYFNFKEIVKKLINKNRFADECTYTPIGELWEDTNAHLLISVEYRVYFTDLTYDTVSFNYEFVKGVNQIVEKQFYLDRSELFPLHKTQNNVGYLTFFKGYPFDISIFGENIQITIDSFLAEPAFIAADLAAMISATHNVITYSNTKGVHRLIISDGVNKWNKIFDKYHSITIGNYMLKLRVIDNKCGIYLKWHNAYGGWDYWLFEKNYINEAKNKSLGIINNDFQNLEETIAPGLSLGQNVSKSLKLFANGVYIEELPRVLEIFSSPKVMMWVDNEWIEVTVNGNSQYKSKDNRASFPITVNLPNYNTLTLL